MVFRIVLVGLALSCAVAGRAAEVVWSIGKNDRSYRELAIAGNYGAFAASFPADVRFRVGTDSPERSWPYIQPGPNDAWAGARPHTFTIEFTLASAPTGAYRLVIDLLNSHYGGPPVVEIDINGRMKLRMRTPAGADDRSLTDPGVNHPSTLMLPFAASYLKAGLNRISITTVSGSWMLYDAVRLESGADIPTTPVVSGLGATSTCLFRREGTALKQAVRIELNNSGAEGPAHVRLSGGVSRDAEVKLAPGINVLDVLVTPVEKPTKARVAVEAGGKTESVELDVLPERRWRVFVAPSAHTDIGYTDLQERTFQRHVANNLEAIRAAATDPEFKWNLEVAGQAQLFRERQPNEWQRLVELARTGQIGVQGSYLNMLTGLCTGEELIRVVEIGQDIADRERFPIAAAAITDVPTVVGAYPTVLAGSGVRYFAEGINQDRGPVFKYADRRMQQSPFWWEGMDGSRVLTCFAFGYAQAGGIGLTTSAEAVARSLPAWLKGFDRPDYPGDAVLVYGAFSDNQPIDPSYARIAEEWNRQWDYPKIIVARLDEFFRYVEARSGPKLPTFRGDMGVYWEDGAGSSALETALNRWAVTRLEAAEARLSLLSKGARMPPAQQAAVAAGWRSALYYDEHTWGAAGSIADPKGEQTVAQWATKAAFATDAASIARRLTEAAHAPTHSAPLAVTNDLTWPRDILVEAPSPQGRWPSTPAQRVGDRTLYLARNVPPMGSAPVQWTRSAPVHATPLISGSNAAGWKLGHYRCRIDPRTGGLSSLVDEAGREWVDGASGHTLNQFVYVLGGEGSGMVYGLGAPPSGVRTLTHTAATVRVVENGPVRATLHIARTGPEVSPVDTYLIVDARGDLQFLNVVRKQETYRKEGGYFAFPFRFARPERCRTIVELPYGVVAAEKEQPAGACKEWYCARSFVAVTDDVATAYLATPHAPLLTIGDVFKGKWKGAVDGRPGTVYGYVFNNYWHTNYKASQGGSLVFSYTLRTRAGGFDPLMATRFGWERRSEMIDPRLGDRPDLWRLAAAEAAPMPAAAPAPRTLAGSAVIGGIAQKAGRLLVRLYNPTSRPTTAVVSLKGLPVRSAALADLIGRPKSPIAIAADSRTVRVPVRARGLATLSLEGGAP